MFLQIHEIPADEVRHLHSTDPRLAEEIAAANRSLNRLDESLSWWTYLDPTQSHNGKEVLACPEM